MAKVVQEMKREALSKPSAAVVRQILKERLSLTYRSYNSANLRYNDESFDGKRLAISRLLTYLMSSDHLVILVDEAHFNHLQHQKRSWQPAQKGTGVQQMDARCRILFEDASQLLAGIVQGRKHPWYQGCPETTRHDQHVPSGGPTLRQKGAAAAQTH